MPCRHAGCEGTAWHIVTIGLSVHHFRLGDCASLQDAAAHLPDHCLPVFAVYTDVWIASDPLQLQAIPMCRSLRIGQRHPMHCRSHQSSDGVWARCHVQQPEYERHSQQCVTACHVYVLVSARGTQPKLDLMADLTVTHCIAVSSSNTTYGVILDVARCYPRQVLVSRLLKCPITNSATSCINGASSI